MDAIKTQFSHLLRTIPETGNIIANADDANIMDIIRRGVWTPVSTFSEYRGTNKADWQWQAIKEDGSHFKLYQNNKTCLEASWDSIGRHHVANACAVAAAATHMGVSLSDIQQAFETFKGVRRRMTKVGEARGITIYDDFAHHPTAIKGVVDAVKAGMNSGKLWVVLEPRSNTMRMKIHQHTLPQSLSSADHVIFTPPSHRNMQENDVLDVNQVCQDLNKQHIGAQVIETTELIIQRIKNQAQSGDIVLILSNGGFEDIHQRLLNTL